MRATATRRRRAVVLVALALGAAGLSAVAGAALRFGPSEVIFPPQKLPIKFSHRLHLGFVVPPSGKKIKLECDFCHEKAPESVSAADNLVPSESVCTDSCHDVDRDDPTKQVAPGRAPARCDACHVGTDFAKVPRVEIPAPNLKFNHKVHVDRGFKCQRCHGSGDVELATRDELPRMPLCLGCHNQTAQKDRASARCATCHLQDRDGTLVQEFPEGRLVPSGTLKGDRHTPDFATHHAQVAKADEKYCAACHRQDFCLGCHNGVVKPMAFHGNDYLSIHAIDARRENLRCEGCHRKQTFCLGCHERSGVVETATADAPNGLDKARPTRRFHPVYDKFVALPRTPEHHAWQAQRNIRQCVSCHREETCLECHDSRTVAYDGLPKNKGWNISPHGPKGSFAGSRECNALRVRSGRMCLKCHDYMDRRNNCEFVP